MKYEQAKSQHRLKCAMANDVWEYRTLPPPEWKKPLMEKGEEESLETESRVLGNVMVAESNGDSGSKQTYSKSVDDKWSSDSSADSNKNVTDLKQSSETSAHSKGSSCVIS